MEESLTLVMLFTLCASGSMPAIKGRGAPTNSASTRFSLPQRQADGDWLDFLLGDDDETPPPLRTTISEERARTIITRNNSPDVGFDQSINAYRGCEQHRNGCVDCHCHAALHPGLALN